MSRVREDVVRLPRDAMKIGGDIPKKLRYSGEEICIRFAADSSFLLDKMTSVARDGTL